MSTTQDTLAMVRDILAKANDPAELAKNTFTQPGSATTGLQTYDLEAPAKNLVPFLSPLRNRIPRVAARGSIQANWKAVTAVNSNQLSAGIAEGRRGGLISVSSADYYAAYRTIGLESSVTFEADLAAEGFDDLRARAVSSLLQATMVEEEKIILGGNATNALGVTPTPSCATSTTGGSIAATTAVSVICVALSFDGYRRFNGASSITQQFSRANQDGTTETINGGTAAPSASGTVTTGAGSTNSVVAKVTPVRGAYGYAWYAGTSGNEKFVSVTAVSQVTITSLPASGQAASSLAATDYSKDTMIHDGLLGIIGNSAFNSYYNAVTAGSQLTADGAGGIVEFDTALQYFWDNLRLAPDQILISSQEAVTIKKIITQAGAATSLARFAFTMTQGGLVGGALPKGYLNPFASQQEIPILQHPYMPAGTVLFLSHTVPYPMNNINNIMQIRTRRDYYQMEWPLRTRSYEYGVYSDQVLQHYFPPSMGVITNLSKS